MMVAMHAAGLARGRGWRIAAFVLAAITLLRTSAADSLWAVNSKGLLNVCEDPSSGGSLDSCFDDGEACDSCQALPSPVTDGVNVYYVDDNAAGYSCPISDLGTCDLLNHMPPERYPPYALAAGNGWLYLGYDNGLIYRCPVGGNQADTCTQWDDAGDRRIFTLLLTNGVLYAGLSQHKKLDGGDGLMWKCDPNQANSCSDFNNPGKTSVLALAAGAGYLWAGLQNHIIWRCSLYDANSCTDWYTASSYISSLSFNGETTMYAGTYNEVLSCSTNGGCTPVYTNFEFDVYVAAGAGSVFYSQGLPYSSSYPQIYFGPEPFESSKQWGSSRILYIPSDTDEEDNRSSKETKEKKESKSGKVKKKRGKSGKAKNKRGKSGKAKEGQKKDGRFD